MIIPSIDLSEGKVVQLAQGREKRLEESDVSKVAERFCGFKEVQVIDIDAAKRTGNNTDIVKKLCGVLNARVGGGIASIEQTASLMDAGAKKIIIGSRAEPDFLERLCSFIGRKRVIVALDSFDGEVVVKGWEEKTGKTVEEKIKELEPYCSEFLFTFVEGEGLLQGFNRDRLERLSRLTGRTVTFAGGIRSLQDAEFVESLGMNSVVGMALYTGKIQVEEALEFNRLDFRKGRGLLPVVVQDAETKNVLMLAYANRMALEKTRREGRACYWSRSREELWVKGSTSGDFQEVSEIRFDCDADTLLYLVRQKGKGACHMGEYSCFSNALEVVK